MERTFGGIDITGRLLIRYIYLKQIISPLSRGWIIRYFLGLNKNLYNLNNLTV